MQTEGDSLERLVHIHRQLHGHHSVDPYERRTERTFGSTGPGRAKLERAGVNLDHFGEEIRFENDSVLLAMVGIIATRAESAEAA